MVDDYMKKKKIIVILTIILIILLLGYIYNSEINKPALNNKHTIDNKINKSDKNINVTNSITNNDDENHNVKSNNQNNEKPSNKTYDEALMAKKMVEKYALNKNEIAKYPIYKSKNLDSWLVPIYDKKTGKFKASVYVYVGKDSSGFVNGPFSYSEYKKLVHGKKIKHNSKDPIKKSKSNKSNKQTKNNNSKINKSNKSKTNNKTTNNSPSYTSKLNQHMDSIELNGTKYYKN